MDFDNWYRTNIESSQEEPPQELWDHLQDDLDLELVWGRIDTQLHPAGKSGSGIFWKVAASVALLIAVGLWQFLPQTDRANSLSLQRLSPRWPQNIQHIIQKSELGQFAPQLALQHESDVVQNDAGSKSHQRADAMMPEATPDGNRLEENLPGLQKISTGINSALASFSVPRLITRVTDHTGLLAMEESNNNSFSFLSLGVSGEFANTWQLNSKTLRGMQSTELTNTQASFVNNLGLVATATISPKMALRADFRFSAQSRQDYQEYIAGKYLSTSLELDYAILSVMLSRRLGAFHSPHWLTAGMYAGHLQQARQNYNGSFLTVKNEYANTDFGIMAGYEYHVPVWKHVYLATGVFTRYGLLNAYSGSQQIPDYMNKTTNAALIFSLSLNYSFR